MEREKLGTRLGFILVSVSCAVGVGNVWKFPYLVGQNGGAVFVLVYLIFLAIMGVPIMTMEFAMGRASKQSPVKMFGTLSPQGPKTKWRSQGYIMLGGNVMLMMYYTSVTAWLLIYTFKMISGGLNGITSAGSTAQFAAITGNPWLQIGIVAIVVVLGVLVCMFGVGKSLEKVTKTMMIALFLLMIAVVVNCMFLPGTAEGLYFYLVPDFSGMTATDVLLIIPNAMSQAFFTLSIGMGSMAIFGSYIDKDRSLLGESVNVAILDTVVALLAGLIIFPACFSYNNGNVNAGPPLIFETLPMVFSNMFLGQLWGAIFFICLCFAALSTVFAVFENIFACFIELTGWSRKKTCLIVSAGIFLLSIPCILGFNVLSGFQPLGAGSTVLDLEDFIVSTLILPISSLFIVIFCTTKFGWGMNNYVNEANQGTGLKVGKKPQAYIKYVLPILLCLFIVGNLTLTILQMTGVL